MSARSTSRRRGGWFVLDRAIAQEHAVTLVGPPWRDVFPTVARRDVLDALAESLRWHEQHEPGSVNTVLNAVRGWRYVESGAWLSRPAAARWLLAHVRQLVAEAR